MADSRPAPDDSLAETGGGIPDEAVLEGELEPGELGEGAEAAVEALERRGWTRTGPQAPTADPRDLTEGQPS